jgi:hypothetical protein
VTRRGIGVLGIAGALGLMLPGLAACGIQPTGITTLGQAPAAQEVSAAPSVDAAAGSHQYVLFFYLGDRLTAAYRTATADTVSESLVLDELLAGPNQAEVAAGYTSMLPQKLTASIDADTQQDAYLLNLPLGLRAKAQFICTMQYIDLSPSVGIKVQESNINWNSCSDTTSEYIPMPGDKTAAAARLTGASTDPGTGTGTGR